MPIHATMMGPRVLSDYALLDEVLKNPMRKEIIQRISVFRQLNVFATGLAQVDAKLIGAEIWGKGDKMVVVARLAVGVAYRLDRLAELKNKRMPRHELEKHILAANARCMHKTQLTRFPTIVSPCRSS